MTVSLRGHDNSNYGFEFEEMCLQARAEDRKWRSRCDMLRKTVRGPYSGDWKSSDTVGWESGTGNRQFVRRSGTQTHSKRQLCWVVKFVSEVWRSQAMKTFENKNGQLVIYRHGTFMCNWHIGAAWCGRILMTRKDEPCGGVHHRYQATFISVCCIFAIWQQCVLLVSLLAVFISVNKIYYCVVCEIGLKRDIGWKSRWFFLPLVHNDPCGKSCNYIRADFFTTEADDGTVWWRNVAEKFDFVHQRYRRTTDGTAMITAKRNVT